ncbi:MAG: hypothetical protein DBP00_03960 [gamma proteobacterium symbiont of Ctena orbiculata]|nr:MAG: hypothetical protein DBP00_03960 [gamma proteobacterium symbiont of Ctena orbiculata]
MRKSSAMRIRMEPELHQQFLAACQKRDIPAAQVLRDFMKKYVEENPVVIQQDMFDVQKVQTTKDY